MAEVHVSNQSEPLLCDIMKTFIGTSQTCDLAEALKAAVLQIPHPRPPDHDDTPVNWTAEKISGKRGGFL